MPDRGRARGAVLAGGAARRYGGVPKGLLDVGGRRILDHVVAVVRGVTGAPPLLIANAPDAATWRPDLKTLPDVRPGFGSLGGIYTAVTASIDPVLCVAWDMPFVPEALLRALVEGAARGTYDAFLPESSGRRGLEPLCAVYGPACAAAIARRLDAGDLKAISFHADVRVGILPLDQVQAFGDPDELFFNVNTPEDLGRAEALWRRHA
jgi:molybdopterin-guanine dinucleotide biosynthesis protein A